MSCSRNRVGSLAALFALAGLLPGAGLASAAASRIVRPVTDAPAPPAAAPAPLAPQGAHVLPLNSMRETIPGVYEGIVPLLKPDGSWMVHLDDRFHAFSVVRRVAGGRLTGSCVHGASGLAHWKVAGVAACSHASATAPVPATATKWEVR
ncbi:MAG: hypothetical protein ABIP29_11245 [Candidatus Eisenbacteria bacterium]